MSSGKRSLTFCRDFTTDDDEEDEDEVATITTSPLLLLLLLPTKGVAGTETSLRAAAVGTAEEGDGEDGTAFIIVIIIIIRNEEFPLKSKDTKSPKYLSPKLFTARARTCEDARTNERSQRRHHPY